MGFISGTSTVTVKAKLTNAGKKKLYDSIESTFLDRADLGDVGAPGFITKFTLGDSDANYAAIDAGSDHLTSGHVPEVSGFIPSMRSFALYNGQYRPGTPVILVDGEYGTNNGITKQVSIRGMYGAQTSLVFVFSVSTQWPKDEVFNEDYKIEIQNPGNLSQATMNKLFSTLSTSSLGLTTTGKVDLGMVSEVAQHSINDGWSFGFKLNGPIDPGTLEMLAGAYSSGNGTIVPIKISGLLTNATVMYNIQLTQ